MTFDYEYEAILTHLRNHIEVSNSVSVGFWLELYESYFTIEKVKTLCELNQLTRSIELIGVTFVHNEKLFISLPIFWMRVNIFSSLEFLSI
jgi:hypothetical protein